MTLSPCFSLSSYHYHVPVPIHLEAGGIHRLKALLESPPARPLLVTGANSARRNGALSALQAQFPGLHLLEGTPENPDTAWCEAGAALCREAGCDGVLAVGGGSPMDAAKAIALLAANPGRARDYFGNQAVPNPPLPLVAVPTTAGSGSEVTPYAVLVDSEERQKRTIRGNAMFPQFALLDPELTLGLPRPVTLATGLDALSQGMEGYVSRSSTPLGDVLALEVCRLVRHWLPRAVEHPEDLEARAAMLHAAMLSGCVIAQSGTTLVHGMGYAYTLHCGVAHGLANGLLLGPVFRYNARGLPEKVAALAEALGVACGTRPEEAADGISAALASLFTALDLSPHAADAGVDAARLPDFAREVSQDPSRFRNQPGAPSPEEVLGFYRASL